MSEELRDIPGFPDYAITRDGRVWSPPKGHSNPKGKWLKPISASKYGHLAVNLWRNGKMSPRKIHQLVLETYVGLRPIGTQCRHLNGDPSDNRLENLKWGTHMENIRDKIRHGTQCRFAGEANAGAKLTEQQVRQIVYTYKTGLFTQREIGEQFGVCDSTICQIVHGKIWRHLWVK